MDYSFPSSQHLFSLLSATPIHFADNINNISYLNLQTIPPYPSYQLPLAFHNIFSHANTLDKKRDPLKNSPPNIVCKIDDSSQTETEWNDCKIEISDRDVEFESDVILKKEECVENSPLQNNFGQEVAQILSYFVNEYGKVNRQEINLYKSIYSHNQILLQLFDILEEKYLSSSKSREDMVRFLLRKAITSIRDSFRKKHHISAKAASLLLCKRYFDPKSNEMIQKLGLKSDEELLQFLLPYKKNSRNKTANTQFITEIFSSDLFYKDYQEYLKNLDDILEKENAKKTKKFVSFLGKCIEEKTLEKIKHYRRLPWLKTWIKSTKQVASELLDAKTWKETHKPPKKQSQKKQKIQ